MLQQNVVLRIQLNELCTWNPGCEDVTFSDRNDGVATCVQHQGRRTNLSKHVGDIDERSRFEESSGDVGTHGPATEVVVPPYLFIGPAGNEARGEDLPISRIIAAPLQTNEINHRLVERCPIGIAAAHRATSIPTIEYEFRNTFRVFRSVSRADCAALRNPKH